MQNLIGQFNDVVRVLQHARIRYAVVGGLAVAIHGGVRTTKDIDLLVHPDDVEALVALLQADGYVANPRSIEFRGAGLKLRRLWKRVLEQEDVLMVDLLLAEQPRHRRMLQNATLLPWGAGTLPVVRPADLIIMKRARLSKTDQVDIQVLQREAKPRANARRARRPTGQ